MGRYRLGRTGSILVEKDSKCTLYLNKIWPFGQLGTLEGTLGANEALLFDRYTEKEVKLYRRNLTVAWTDVKNAYDSLYQEFIIQIHQYLKSQAGL